MMRRFTFLRFLSIEVVLDAMAVGIFAVKWLRINPPAVWWPVLAISVWIIYTTDHLIDAWQLKDKSTIDRHRFHHTYFGLFIGIIVVLAIGNLMMISFFSDPRIIAFGILLAFIVFAYFTALLLKNIFRVHLPKELIVAFVFVSGIWFVPILLSNRNMDLLSVFILILFLGLAFCEGAMVSFFEYKQDSIDSHTSFAVPYGTKITQKIIKIILFILLITNLFLYIFTRSTVEVAGLAILLFMNLLLFIIVQYPDFFAKKGRYRIVGDLVFLMPALLYWM
jgi:hypothetical protein